jgi:hypothetical protein
MHTKTTEQIEGGRGGGEYTENETCETPVYYICYKFFHLKFLQLE